MNRMAKMLTRNQKGQAEHRSHANKWYFTRKESFQGLGFGFKNWVNVNSRAETSWVHCFFSHSPLKSIYACPRWETCVMGKVPMQYHCVSLLIFTMTKEFLLLNNPFFFNPSWSGFTPKSWKWGCQNPVAYIGCRAKNRMDSEMHSAFWASLLSSHAARKTEFPW